MGLSGLRDQILSRPPPFTTVHTAVDPDTCNSANAEELLHHRTSSRSPGSFPTIPPTSFTPSHRLVVRRSDKGYKAVILCARTFRLESPEAHSVQQALELLLELTAEMLEEVAEVWEYKLFEGEEVEVFEDGARVVVKREEDE